MQITVRRLARIIRGLPEPNAFHGDYVSADAARDDGAGFCRITFKKVRITRADGFGYEWALDIGEK